MFTHSPYVDTYALYRGILEQLSFGQREVIFSVIDHRAVFTKLMHRLAPMKNEEVFCKDLEHFALQRNKDYLLSNFLHQLEEHKKQVAQSPDSCPDVIIVDAHDSLKFVSQLKQLGEHKFLHFHIDQDLQGRQAIFSTKFPDIGEPEMKGFLATVTPPPDITAAYILTSNCSNLAVTCCQIFIEISKQLDGGESVTPKV